MTTAEFTRWVVEFLNWRGHHVWRQNVGTITRGRRPPKEQTGIGDIVGVLRPGGLHVEIEVKKRGEKQRPSQVTHQMRVESCAGIYLITHDKMEFEEQYERIILPRLKRYRGEVGIN